MLLFWITVAIFIDAVIGIMVLDSIDKDGRLLAWYKACPNPFIQPLVLILWPVVLMLVIADPNHR
jgi:hypothetical protein